MVLRFQIFVLTQSKKEILETTAALASMLRFCAKKKSPSIRKDTVKELYHSSANKGRKMDRKTEARV